MRLIITIIGFVLILGCTQTSNYIPVQEVNPEQDIELIRGLGIESKDVVKMSKKMVRDILQYPIFIHAEITPSIIIDDKRFLNESNQIINTSMLLDRLRIELMRASLGKLKFVSRENMDLAMNEKKLEMQGYTEREDSSDGLAVSGAKYRMVGKITSLSTASNNSGIKSNYYQFTFEIIDLDNSDSVWGNIYEIKKYGADDVLYN